MKTKEAIPYHSGLMKATIPAGTPVRKATNLPFEGDSVEYGQLYWADSWDGMTDEEESYHRNYGFLVRQEQVA